MKKEKPYIIAEIGSNFDQSLKKAKKMISAAKKCGASAVKFQLFNPRKLYPSKSDKKIRSIFEKIKLRKHYIPQIIKFSRKEKIEIFFSVFDITNLNVLKNYKKRYPDFILGFSDHTISNLNAIVAVGIGCTYFEKHFTLNKKSKGPDHFFAYNVKQFKKYVQDINRAYNCLGNEKKMIHPKEREIGRREGIYAKMDIKAGEKISSKNIFKKFPSLGLRFRDKDLYINKFKAKKNILKFQPIYKSDLKK